MKYLIIWVGVDGNLIWAVKNSKKDTEKYIESLSLGERLSYYKGNLHDKIEIFEVEPNFEALDFNIAMITTVVPKVVIK